MSVSFHYVSRQNTEGYEFQPEKERGKNDCVHSAISACAHVLEYTEGQKVFLCLGSKSVGNYSIST